MKDLSTQYMGLKLKNPVIVGASSLTSNLDTIKEIEAAGAGAIVTKSLFEEQLQLERYRNELERELTGDKSAEMIDSALPDLQNVGAQEHLYWLKRTKETVQIPVIGSLNAVNKDTWLEYAVQLANTGIDGLELNFYSVPDDLSKTGAAIEDEQVELLKQICSAVKIPVAVKLSSLYTNPLQVVQRMSKTGIAGVVLFNRFIQPDIDIETMEHHSPFNLSNPQDNHFALRYTGLLSQQISAQICSSGGIFSAADVIKMILAGASAVQIVSALYDLGIGHIATILDGIEAWMTKNGFHSLADFQGSMNKINCHDPWVYTRAQYVKILMKPQSLRRNKMDF